ncbi:tail assembly protein [Serratia fonticola]|uniref:tail assembly protein n=1 Tax=Serratia fonticola TaxID=47917 RepID=UPI0015C5F5EF|nr:tail assembly protein [Serratia fonticola]NYA37111.1 tail assembly protein [Serratia fonticola]
MAFIDVPMRKMVFHGPLIGRFGREFKYKAHNVPKMMSAAKSLLDGFERYMVEAHKRGLTFAVFVGNERKRNIAETELEMTKGSEDIHLVPMIIGSKRAGLFQTILGVALISAALFTPAGVLAAAGLSAGTLGMVGASMALGGLVQMLSPQAGGLRMRESPDNKPSYAFGGPVNTTAQGNPVAVGYGCREIGGAVISAGIYTEDQQ